MFTSTNQAFTQWKDTLIDIGLKEHHVTEDIVAMLEAYGFNPGSLNDESFQGYKHGSTESEAGVSAAKEMAALNDLQVFLEPAIDWEQAWKNLKLTEGYMLLKTADVDTWALFYR